MGAPRVRFTVRRMMVAVAIVALVGFSARMWQRSRVYDARARMEASQAQSIRQRESMERQIAHLSRDRINVREAQFGGSQEWTLRPGEPETETEHWARAVRKAQRYADWLQTGARLDRATRYRRRAEYHESLERKYRLAAISPWFTVPPDPPEPQ